MRNMKRNKWRKKSKGKEVIKFNVWAVERSFVAGFEVIFNLKIEKNNLTDFWDLKFWIQFIQNLTTVLKNIWEPYNSFSLTNFKTSKEFYFKYQNLSTASLKF